MTDLKVVFIIAYQDGDGYRTLYNNGGLAEKG